MTMVALGKRIRQFRESRGLSQEALAKLLGVSRPTLSLIEAGERKVTADEVKRLGDIFNISVDSFFDETREPRVVIAEARAEYKKARDEIRIGVPRKNLEKFKEVLLYVLNKVGGKPNVGETVLYKLLYFIDFDYYEQYEEQMVGATYKKNRFGPTPLEFRKVAEKMMEARELQKLPNKYFEYPQTKYLPLRAPDLSRLNGREVDIIDRVLDRLSDMTAAQISEYSHNDVPWLSTDEGGIIPYETVFYRTPAYSMRAYDAGLS
jgi:transcriptional regulator with XRE-family HTH domain